MLSYRSDDDGVQEQGYEHEQLIAGVGVSSPTNIGGQTARTHDDGGDSKKQNEGDEGGQQDADPVVPQRRPEEPPDDKTLEGDGQGS